MARYQIPSFLENPNVPQSSEVTQPTFSINSQTNPKNPRFTNEEIKKKSANKSYIYTNFSVFPSSVGLSLQTKAPLCVSVEPFAEKKQGSKLGEVPVIDLFKKQNCIRCKECSAYISSFCQFIDQGKLWVCAMCGKLNTLPLWYYSPLRSNGIREDIQGRSELASGVYEFLPAEDFMNRDPIMPVYFFLLDVTRESTQSGRLSTIAEQLRAILGSGQLFGQGHARIGFLTFDSTVHVWSFNPEKEKPHMFVLSDFDDFYLPCPLKHIIISPNSQKEMIFQFLDSLPTMFLQGQSQKNEFNTKKDHNTNDNNNNNINKENNNKNNNNNLNNNNINNNNTNLNNQSTFEEQDSAFSLALQMSYLIMSSTGGKIMLTLTSRPSLGKFALKNRLSDYKKKDQKKMPSLLSPIQNTGSGLSYRDMAVNFNNKQISVDIFFFPQGYFDIATIGSLARYTSGEVFYYRDYDHSHPKNGAKRAFKRDLAYVLKRFSTWESVMRSRVSKEFQISRIYGNFMLSSSKLLKAPNISPDDSFLFQIDLGSNLSSDRPFLIQTAIVYTDEKQQRRVRVLTSAIPTTSNLFEVFESLNCEILFNYQVRNSIEIGLKEPLLTIRQRLLTFCIEFLKGVYRLTEGKSYLKSSIEQGGQALILPSSLTLMPLFTLGLIKNLMFDGSPKINIDERAFHFLHYRSRSYHDTTLLLCPPFYRIDQLDPNSNQPEFPSRLPLNYQNLKKDGLYIFTNGLELYIYIGQQSNKYTLSQLFGIDNVFNIASKDLFLPKLENKYNILIRQFVKSLNNQFSRNLVTRVIKQGEIGQETVFRWLIEDRTQINDSFSKFNKSLLKKFQNLSYY
ncbi:sec24-related protein [Anaeramoeba flamelloides]|uniref:Sec24-related protein n=1 Tax=Anaeramoeba flamelloides TaxID=1746091 RepID=A0ABQ8XSW9_9EUKA|nr:sec24-related protein [Anaeramoeba flamelloides]